MDIGKYVIIGMVVAFLLVRIIICVITIRRKTHKYKAVSRAYEEQQNSKLFMRNNIIVELTADDIQAAITAIPHAEERIIRSE